MFKERYDTLDFLVPVIRNTKLEQNNGIFFFDRYAFLINDENDGAAIIAVSDELRLIDLAFYGKKEGEMVDPPDEVEYDYYIKNIRKIVDFPYSFDKNDFLSLIENEYTSTAKRNKANMRLSFSEKRIEVEVSPKKKRSKLQSINFVVDVISEIELRNKIIGVNAEFFYLALKYFFVSDRIDFYVSMNFIYLISDEGKIVCLKNTPKEEQI